MAITQLQSTDRVADWLAKTNDIIDEINNGIGNRDALTTTDKTIVGAINEIAGPGAVGTINLADGAVTTNIIADNAVTSAKIVENIVLPGTGYTKLPAGTTAERPLNAQEGYIRYNTDFASYEQYTDIGWIMIVGAPIVTSINGILTESSSTSITLNGSGFTPNMQIWAVDVDNNYQQILEMVNVIFISSNTVQFQYPASINPIPASINNIAFKVKSGASNLSSISADSLTVNRGPVFSTTAQAVIADFTLR